MKLAGLTAVVMTLLAGMAAPAQETPPPEVTAETAQAWADRTLGGALEDGRITGAVVSVVRDGEIVYEAGYGLGDVVADTPASPRTTRVRIGSTSKTFTATIIAQLIAEGRIASLEDPANTYLERYSLPDNESSPITLRHLLTHTAGFEDRFYFIGADRPVEIPVDADLFDSLRPPFARPVDDRVDYSNFGVATLGLVIEDQTGQSIDAAMETRLFGPIGMTQTDLAVSIEEPDDLARPGLLSADGLEGPVPFTAINPAVAQTGSIVSTAHDMALYMNAQLGTNDLIDPTVLERLHTRITGNHPDLNGIGMVFFIDDWAGERVVSHGGNWAGFHTWMTLLPDRQTGMFVTLLSEAPPTNFGGRFMSAISPENGPAPSPALRSASSISNSFLTEFLGTKRPLVSAGADNEADLQRYAGLYRADRRPFSTIEELSSLVYFGGEVLRVTVGEDGLYLGGAGPWLPQGGGRFVLDIPSRPMMVIEPHPRTGRLVLTPDIGIYTFARIPAWAHPKLHALALCGLLPLLLALGLAAPLTGRGPVHLGTLAALAGSVALLLGATFVGLEPGSDLMSGYYAGHIARIAVFWFAATAMMLAAAGAAGLALLGHDPVPARLHRAAAGAVGLAATALLAAYGAVGITQF